MAKILFARLVRLARNSKAPLIGLAGVKGASGYAVCLPRAILVGLIRGLDEGTEASVENGCLVIRSLDGRRTYRLIDQNARRLGGGSDEVRRCLSNWAKARRKKKINPPSKPKRSCTVPSYLYKELKQAEERLADSWDWRRSSKQNLFRWLHCDRLHCNDGTGVWKIYGKTEVEYRQDERDRALKYYLARPARKKLAAIAALYLSGKATLREVYKSVKAAGFEMKPLSQHSKVAIYCGSEREFVQHLPLHCGIPNSPPSPWKVADWEACREYNDSRREFREHQAQAAAKVERLKANIAALESFEEVEVEAVDNDAD